MPKSLSPLVLRASAGFVLGLAVWGGLSVPYTRLLGILSESALRMVDQQAVTHLTPQGTMLMVERSDLRTPRAAGTYAVESTDLTFNLIVLLTLFAASPQPFADRNIFGFVAAALGLAVVHVAAVISFVEAYYAASFGEWSAARYGFVARHFWGAAPYCYSIVGVYGSAVALWWLLRPPPQAAAKPASGVRHQAARAGHH